MSCVVKGFQPCCRRQAEKLIKKLTRRILDQSGTEVKLVEAVASTDAIGDMHHCKIYSA
jgi:hypothetical protein